MKPSEIRVGRTYKARDANTQRTVVVLTAVQVQFTQENKARGKLSYCTPMASFARWAGSEIK